MSKKLSLEEKIANQKARLAKLESLKSQKVIHENVVLKELPENKIKVGDKVVAVENINNQLTKDKTYIVTFINNYGDISVTMNDGKEGGFFNYRFKLAPKEEMKSSPKIEVEKKIIVKPGDYVVPIETAADQFIKDNIYICNSQTTPHFVNVDKDNRSRPNGWDSKFFRFATDDEIYQYLLKQANNKGIKIGAKVKWLYNNYKVESFSLINEYNSNNSSILVKGFWDATEIPFLAGAMIKDKTDSSIRFKIESFDLITKSDIKNQSIKVKNYFDKFQRPFLACACPAFQIPVDLVEVVDEKKEAAKIRADLEAKMIKEANDKGFIVGATVIRLDEFQGVIDSLFLVDETNYKNYSWSIQDRWQKNNIAFLGVKYKDRTTPLFEFTLKPDDEISIIIDGVCDNKYIAKFDNYKKFVTFGCAAIDYHIFIELDKLFNYDGIGNRKIETVKIGKGIFTAELIKKIANKIRENVKPKEVVKVERYFARNGKNGRPLPFSNCRYCVYISDEEGYNVRFDGSRFSCNMALPNYYIELTEEEANNLPNYNDNGEYHEPSIYYIACNKNGKPSQFSTTGYFKVVNGVVTRIFTDGKCPEKQDSNYFDQAKGYIESGDWVKIYTKFEVEKLPPYSNR